MKSILLLFTSILFTIIFSEVIVRNIDLETKTNTHNKKKENISSNYFSPEIRSMFSKVPSPIIKDFVEFKKDINPGYCCQEYRLAQYPFANVSSRVKKFDPTNQNVLYNVTYNFNKYGRRITPTDDNTKRSKNLLFLGGSYTFGEGVEDNETFPYYFSKLAKNIVPYNIAFHGYGINDIYYNLKLKKKGMFANINTDRETYAIYYFMDHHIKRTIFPLTSFVEIENLKGKNPKWPKLKEWYEAKPYYQISENELVLKGRFEERVNINYIYSKLAKLKLISKTGIDDYIERKIHFPDFLKFINHLHKELIKTKNLKKLFIIIHPKHTHLFKNFKKDLDSNIRIIKIDQSYPSIKKFLNQNHEYVDDHHPTKYFNKFLAYEVYLKIKNDLN